MNTDPNEEIAQDVLHKSGSFVIIVRSEDETLNYHSLKKKMPQSWHFGSNRFARYEATGIELSSACLKVKGRIQR